MYKLRSKNLLGAALVVLGMAFSVVAQAEYNVSVSPEICGGYVADGARVYVPVGGGRWAWVESVTIKTKYNVRCTATWLRYSIYHTRPFGSETLAASYMIPAGSGTNSRPIDLAPESKIIYFGSSRFESTTLVTVKLEQYGRFGPNGAYQWEDVNTRTRRWTDNP